MHTQKFLSRCFIVLAPLFPGALPGGDTPAPPPGHSIHGEAFDEGPRQQASRMEGVGDVHFPVTAANPEAQVFMDQGVAQLHTFYYFEAERSFRQSALLDPSCAMAYWGMAMANQNNGKRARAFLEKAAARKEKASDRERKYIDALSELHREGKSDAERREAYLRGLEAIVLAYPDDIEAKAFLAWTVIGNSWGGDKISSHVATDLLIEEVLRKSPMHPGAHHYRIHLWDSRDPEQALRSAAAYAKAAPGIAHAWHMPGHIYSDLFRWKEAVYQQEAAAAIDHAHMYAHAIFPFQIHNYAHNQNYLIANLSHLGGVREGIAYAQNLVESPRDPEQGSGAQSLGRFSLMRLYVRFERWDSLLDDVHLDWSDAPEEKVWKAYGRGFAFLGKDDRANASEELLRLSGIAAEAAKKPGRDADLFETARCELAGRLRVREGQLLEGFDLLAKGSKLYLEKFKGDLAGYPRPFQESVALAHLEAQNWGLAEASFRAVLEDRKGTLVSLAGLVEACHRRGREEETTKAYAEFLAASRRADQDLPFARRFSAFSPALAAATPVSGAGVQEAAGGGGSSGTSGPGGAVDADPPLPPGPRVWTPSPAPDFQLEDSGGAKVELSRLRGRNVLLLFHLGFSCPHCMEQLAAVAKERESLEKLGTTILALSDETPEAGRTFLASPRGQGVTFPLLADPERRVAKLYGVHDTFEDLAIHGVVLIERDGGIRWSRRSAQPFMDVAFLKSEIERFERLLARKTRIRL